MKEITIKVPDGKRAEWINGVLTLVDEEKVDNRPVTERIKTFADACNELDRMASEGNETAGNLLADYESNVKNMYIPQTRAYMRLAIITFALNEGWEPQFTEDETRYFSWFGLYTQEEYDNMDDEQKGRCILRSGVNAVASCGSVYVYAHYAASFSGTGAGFGSRLAFRTRKLADYATVQFIEEWADFMFKPRTSEE